MLRIDVVFSTKLAPVNLLASKLYSTIYESDAYSLSFEVFYFYTTLTNAQMYFICISNVLKLHELTIFTKLCNWRFQKLFLSLHRQCYG